MTDNRHVRFTVVQGVLCAYQDDETRPFARSIAPVTAQPNTTMLAHDGPYFYTRVVFPEILAAHRIGETWFRSVKPVFGGLAHEWNATYDMEPWDGGVLMAALCPPPKVPRVSVTPPPVELAHPTPVRPAKARRARVLDGPATVATPVFDA